MNFFFTKNQKVVYSHFEASTISETKIAPNKQSWYIDYLRPDEFFQVLICVPNRFEYIVWVRQTKMAHLGVLRTNAAFWGRNEAYFENLPFSNKKRFFAAVGFVRCMGTTGWANLHKITSPRLIFRVSGFEHAFNTANLFLQKKRFFQGHLQVFFIGVVFRFCCPLCSRRPHLSISSRISEKPFLLVSGDVLKLK